jgi:formamidopyrimidine-DNA glycosylase
MPELPDLHVFSRNLKQRIMHKQIAEVTVYNTQKINTPNIFCENLTGTSIKDIIREGKELHFLLANQNSFGVHLMLSGKFSIVNRNEVEKINSKIAALYFEDGSAFVVSDEQGLCKVMLNPKPSKVPDALSDTFTFEYFAGQIKRKAGLNIKAFLTDQKIIRGIGNAYVDEILWKADISPESVSGKIPEVQLKDLFLAIPFIVNDAIQNIQRISPDIISGEERSFLRVHNPRKKCTDDGYKIIIKTVAGKKTYFTEKQKLFK